MVNDLSSFRSKMKKKNTPTLRLKFAQAITHVINNAELKEKILLLDELRTISAKYLEPKLQFEFAKAITIITTETSYEQAIPLLNELRDLLDKSNEAILCSELAKTITNITAEASYEQGIPLLDELRGLLKKNNEPPIRSELAKSITNITAVASYKQAKPLLDELRILVSKYDEPALRHEFANIITNVTAEASYEEGLELLDELRTALKKNNEQNTRLQFANAITNVIPEANYDQATKLLNELRAFIDKNDDIYLYRQLPMAIANTVTDAPYEQATPLLDELRTLVSEYDEPRLRLEFVRAVSNIIAEAPSDQWTSLLNELKSLLKKYDEPDLRLQLTKAITNVTTAASYEQAAPLLNEFRIILSKYDEPSIRLQFAKAITNVTAVATNEQATPLLDEFRTILNEYTDPKFRLLFAKAITNAISVAPYERATMLLNELRTMLNDHYDPKLQVVFGTAIANLITSAPMGRAAVFIKELSDLSKQHNDPELRLALANAITNGISKASKEQNKKFIEELREISNNHDEVELHLQFATALYNMGVHSYKKNDLVFAHKYFTESKNISLSIPNQQGQEILYNLQRALKIIEEGVEQENSNSPMVSQFEHEDLSEHEGLTDQTFSARKLKDTLETIISKCQPEKEALLKKMTEREQRVDAFLARSSLFAPEASVLLILRQWNSFTPIISDEAESDRGGGYFIFHKGVGLVIDPGYDFIENFNNAGGRIHDITHIAITHAHDDHTAQLEQLLTMFHQYNSKNKGNEKQITLLLNHSTLKKFSGFSLHKDTPYIKRVICLNAFDEKNSQRIFLDDGQSISLTVLPAYHNDVFSAEYAVGFGITALFDKEEKHILFTGDTGLYPPLLDKNGKVQSYKEDPYNGEKKVDETPEKAINNRYPEPFHIKPDLLIPHIGSIKKYEIDIDVKVDLDLERHNKKPLYYPNHLGLLGVSTLTFALKPTSVVLSELGAELKDFRADLIKILREAMEKANGKDKAPFIVLGDNTIAYEIPSGKFLCHSDCQFHDPKDLEPIIAGHGEVGLFKKDKKEYVFTNYYDALERHITKTTGKKEKLYIPYLKQEEDEEVIV